MTRKPRTPEERRLGEDRKWFANQKELRFWFEEELLSLVEAGILPPEMNPSRTEHEVRWGERDEFSIHMSGGGFLCFGHAHQAEFYIEWYPYEYPNTTFHGKDEVYAWAVDLQRERDAEDAGRDTVFRPEWFPLDDPDYTTYIDAVIDHFAHTPIGIRGGTGKHLIICNGFDPFDMTAHFADVKDKLGWEVEASNYRDTSVVRFEHGNIMIPHDARLTPVLNFHNSHGHCVPLEIEKVLDGHRKMLQQFRLYLRMYRDRENVRKA